MTDEQLAEMDKLTDLSHNQMADLLHAIWLAGFNTGCADASWRIQRKMHGTIGDIFLAGDDVTATKLREIYKYAEGANDQAQRDKVKFAHDEESAKSRIRNLFRLCSKIVLESERR